MLTFRDIDLSETETGSVRSYGDESSEEVMRVTRSIMIVKPPGYMSGSPPVSPAGTTPPVSPFSGKVVICLLLCFYHIKIEVF